MLFFADERGCGHIVMEFIDGKVIEPLDETGTFQRVAEVLEYFATLRGTTHGSPGFPWRAPSLSPESFSSLKLTAGCLIAQMVRRSGSTADYSNIILNWPSVAVSLCCVI